MNAFGERQHVEKFIPMTIKKILNHEKILIHSNKTKTKPGSRFYIHARNISDAVLFLIKNGKLGDKYNISGGMKSMTQSDRQTDL
jgi:dTDP-glucose 4,6-dehydratase